MKKPSKKALPPKSDNHAGIEKAAKDFPNARCMSDLVIPRAEAVHAKHCLQSALELVNRTHAMLLPGPQADQLDHAARMICVGITVLRDADRLGNDTAGIRKVEREPSMPHAPCSMPEVSP